MDAMSVALNNYSKTVSHCNKISKLNQNLQKENKNLQAQKLHLLKAFEKLKDFVLRRNSTQNDSRIMPIKNDNKISNFDICEDNQSCCSKSSVKSEQTILISTHSTSCSDHEKMSEISVETNISDYDFLSKLMNDIDLFCSTKAACDPHVKLIKKLQKTLMDAMQLDELNEINLNKKQEEINHFLKQIDDEKDENECKKVVISRMEQEISELADALEDQFLKNKNLISCNKEQRRINDAYLKNKQTMECALSNAEVKYNDLTTYTSELENNLKKENIDNCKKSNIILDLQQQINAYTSKIEELDFQVRSSACEIAEYKEKYCTLFQINKKLKYHHNILKIELKSTNLQLYVSKDLSNIKIDENEILIRKIESLKNKIDDFERALQISRSENNSLVEKSIADGIEILNFVNKIHLLEHEIKQGKDNVKKLNNRLEYALTQENNTQKELEECCSLLLTKIDDNNSLQLKLVETQKNLENAYEKLSDSQQQLQNTNLELNKERIKYKKAIEEYELQADKRKCEEKLNSSQGKIQDSVIGFIREQNEKKIVSEEHINEVKSISTESIQTDLLNSIEFMNVNKTESPSIVQTEIEENEEKLILSTDLVNGQSSKVKDKYEENELLNTKTYVNEIVQLSLEDNAIRVQPKKNQNLKVKSTSRLFDTSLQKCSNVSVNSLKIYNSEPNSESNVSVQKMSKLSESNVNNSDSNCTSGCSCSVDSSKSKCDCIFNYFKNSEKSLSNELNTMKHKQKKYKRRICELENCLIYENLRPQFCDSNIIPEENNKLQDEKLAHDCKNVTKSSDSKINLKATEDKKPVSAQQNSTEDENIEQIETLQLNLKKHKTKKIKKSKQKIVVNKKPTKLEIKYNLPCTSCTENNCYYNRTAPRTKEEWDILAKQLKIRWMH